VAPQSRPEDLLEPVDVLHRLREVELTLGQACRVAGVSRMQLDYWTTRARIPTKGKKQRLYDLDAVETVMLIKQGKDKGLSLQAAIEAAQRFKASRGSSGRRR
jgi:DNA-binding transcriptional MerR regulator